MPNERTGTIEWKRGVAYARVWLDRPDGTKQRKRVKLGTRDPKVAERMLAKVNGMIARGDLVADDGAVEAGPDEFRAFAEQWVTNRKTRKVAMAPDEHINLRRHVYEVQTEGRAFGTMCLIDVRPRHIVAVLQAVIDEGLAKGTVDHVKRLLSRIFRAAVGKDLILANPVTAADTPRIPDAQKTEKEREILTDAEVAQFLECGKVDLELRMMSLVARTLGGGRTSDVNRWAWTHIDTRTFEVCTIPRSKTGKPQRIEIPEMLRPFLAAWWIGAGKPAGGPVFPVTRGKRKGEFRATRGVSYAKRLRRALKVAGVFRTELHQETETTLPVDFHSFRRAFATALAEAGVNEQKAMALASHSDPKTHQRYVMKTRAMMRIPAAALPSFNGGTENDEAPAGDSSAEASPQTALFGAGNGIRTRDPQLGKLDSASDRSGKLDDRGFTLPRRVPFGDACFTWLRCDGSPLSPWDAVRGPAFELRRGRVIHIVEERLGGLT